MKLKLKITSKFKRRAKLLIKKYPSFKLEIASLIKEIEANPNLGTAIKYNCRKIRVSIKSKGKGKSGGARVITYLHYTATTIYLIYIYDKSKIDNISDAELLDLLGEF